MPSPALALVPSLLGRSLLLAGAILLSGCCVFFSSGLKALALDDDEGPVVSIKSPQIGTTFAIGTVKSQQLYWDKKKGLLVASVVFTDRDYPDTVEASDDVQEFTFPGVYYDVAKGVFWTMSFRNEAVPVAKRVSFFGIESVKILPNAVIRVIRKKSEVKAILEAVRPDDPALHRKEGPTDSNATKPEPIDQLFH